MAIIAGPALDRTDGNAPDSAGIVFTNSLNEEHDEGFPVIDAEFIGTLNAWYLPSGPVGYAI